MVAAGCSSSTGSGPVGSEIPGVPPVSTAPSVSDPAGTPVPVATTGSTSTAPATTEPPSTDPPATEPGPIDPPPLPDGPTNGLTVVHVGSDGGFAWTPLAIWTGIEWAPADVIVGDATVPVPPSTFSDVSVASLSLAEPLSGLSYSAENGDVCFDDRIGPLLDVGVPIPDLGVSEDFTGFSGSYTAASAAGDWNIEPRPVLQVGLAATVYQTVGESIVSGDGLDPTGGDVVQVVRADLDGNGVEEVLVTFQKITNEFGALGDFSVIYVRYPAADGSVVDKVLWRYYPDEPVDHPTPGGAALLAVADFNGDAIMEVVVRSAFWETALAELYVMIGGELTSVAVTGCGA